MTLGTLRSTKKYPRVVRLLSLSSFFNDTASEAIYHVLPIFLSQTLGVGGSVIGTIEGFAQAVVSVTKFASGYLSDRSSRKSRWVFWGYLLANAVRPLLALATQVSQVFAIRFADRVGKGMRGAPRDAWLSASVPAKERGSAFGLNRAMDHLGAATGTLGAAAFLFFFPEKYRVLFALTVIPGVFAVLCIRVAARNERREADRALASKPRVDLKILPRDFYKFLAVSLVFAVGNSSDVFLLLKLRRNGLPDFALPLVWMALHFVKAYFSARGGQWVDRFGKSPILQTAWLVFGITYLAFGTVSNLWMLVPVFFFYGIFHGLSEPAERVFIADVVVESQSRGTAFGIFDLFVGLGAIPAGIVAGLLWDKVSPGSAFLFGAAAAGLAIVMLRGPCRVGAGDNG